VAAVEEHLGAKLNRYEDRASFTVQALSLESKFLGIGSRVLSFRAGSDGAVSSELSSIVDPYCRKRTVCAIKVVDSLLVFS
jgi:hypothetical protein